MAKLAKNQQKSTICKKSSRRKIQISKSIMWSGISSNTNKQVKREDAYRSQKKK